jgi:hypothetical protein
MLMVVATMVASSTVEEMVLEVLATVAVVGVGVARLGCLEVRLMVARSLAKGWAEARPRRARLQQRALRSSRR